LQETEKKRRIGAYIQEKVMRGRRNNRRTTIELDRLSVKGEKPSYLMTQLEIARKFAA